MEGIALNRRAFGVAALVGGSLILSPNGSAQHSSKILSRKQLADLVSTAKTADDHRKLAEHYRAMGTQHEVEADEQVELAAKYRANPTASESKRPGAPDTASHCLTYADHCRNAAKAMSELAAMHERMAKS